ncbi:MAG: tripartite tricarboxylate transporter substrate binding protein, partial [Burkholderiales bacterium]
MSRITRHAFIAFAAVIGFQPQSLPAQAYPAKPIRVIVPFGAGGPADIYARFLGQHMQGPLGQPWVVETRPGAGSIIGTEIVAKSPADGYTLLVMSNTHTVNESLVPKKPFVLMRDFVAVAPINYSDLLLVVHPSVPAKSVKELVALAKTTRGGMNYSSSGTGTPYHMAGELFKALAGVDILHVPHKSSGDARTSVMSGQTEMMLDAITTMLPIAKGGQVRALATSGRTRSSVAPDLPTIAEAGVKGYETTIWIGVMAPTGTPRAIVERLNAEITKVANRSDVREVWAK